MRNEVTPPRNAAQPGLSSTSKIYGAKKLPTISVTLKDSDDDRLVIVNQSDFDPDLHERVD